MYTQTTYHIRRILEYSEFFKGEDPIDISSTLKLFNRNTLVRMAAENGGYPPTQNGDIRSLFWLFSLMALQN